MFDLKKPTLYVPTIHQINREISINYILDTFEVINV